MTTNRENHATLSRMMKTAHKVATDEKAIDRAIIKKLETKVMDLEKQLLFSEMRANANIEMYSAENLSKYHDWLAEQNKDKRLTSKRKSKSKSKPHSYAPFE
jgi:hypothetical protein